MFPSALKTFEQNSSHPSIVSRWRVCWGPTLVLDILHYGIGLHWLIHFKVCNGEKEKQIHPQKMQQWRSVLVFFFLRIFLVSWICWSSRDIEWNWYNLSIANSYHRFETVRQRNIFIFYFPIFPEICMAPLAPLYMFVEGATGILRACELAHVCSLQRIQQNRCAKTLLCSYHQRRNRNSKW